MYNFEDIQKKIQYRIGEMSFPASPQELYEPIEYLMNLNGKRLRPCLFLLGANLFTDDIDSFIDLALAMEVFHNFTLMHDDIMDQAPLRRGRPTVHTKWDIPIAILSGDAMLVEAYKLLSKAPGNILKTLLDIFNKTATQVCEGQQMDMNYEKLPRISIPEYLAMIELKTAVLLGTCLELGALSGGACPEDASHCGSFGRNIGMAFQLQDDLLDTFGDPIKFGKVIGGDILMGKKTYLLVKAMELTSDPHSNELKNWLQKKEFNPNEKVEAIQEIYTRMGIPVLIEEEIKAYLDKAVENIHSLSLANQKKENLLILANNLLQRKY